MSPGMGLLYGPRGGCFLMSEVPLYEYPYYTYFQNGRDEVFREVFRISGEGSEEQVPITRTIIPLVQVTLLYVRASLVYVRGSLLYVRESLLYVRASLIYLRGGSDEVCRGVGRVSRERLEEQVPIIILYVRASLLNERIYQLNVRIFLLNIRIFLLHV